MPRPRTVEDEIQFVGSSYLRAKKHYLAIIYDKQRRLGNKTVQISRLKKRSAAKLERELQKLTDKYEAKIAKLKEQQARRDMILRKMLFDRHSIARRLRISNKKLMTDATQVRVMKRFFTTAYENRGDQKVINNELFIRYVYFMEAMFTKRELDKYAYLLMLSCAQAEYITLADLIHRFGKLTADRCFKKVSELSDEGFIVKFNKKPIRVALTDLGRKRLTSVVYACKNRSFRNYV